MYFLIAKNIDTELYLVCDKLGEQKRNITKEEFNSIKSKISQFKESNVAIYKNGKLIKNSITVLGKYYHGKGKDLKFLVCDGTCKRFSVTKREIIENKSKMLYSNIIICNNNSIRMISGSIPFLNNLTNLRNTDTVIKLGNIQAGTPGSIGVSKKVLGRRIRDNKIGCVKLELFPNSYDINNEVLAYKLGQLLGFDVAEASFEKYTGKRSIISIYNYDTINENIKSLKSEIGTENFHSKFNKNWFMQNKSESAWNKFIQMIMFDIIMHQTDRHISNIAFKNKDLYSLYDNGRALFFDNYNEAYSQINLSNRGSIVESFHTNEHGYGWMYLEDILGYNNYKHLINTNLKPNDFRKIVNESYGDKDIFRNNWVAEYMFKTYLIVTRQERRWSEW